MTFEARFGILDARRMIAFDIELGRHFKGVTRAVFNAERASFASVFSYVNFAMGDYYLVRIKGFSPEFHRCVLYTKRLKSQYVFTSVSP